MAIAYVALGYCEVGPDSDVYDVTSYTSHAWFTASTSEVSEVRSANANAAPFADNLSV